MDFTENHRPVYTHFAPNAYRTSRVVGRSGSTCPDMGATMFSEECRDVTINMASGNDAEAT